jgi:hypothetical protein
MTNEEKIVRRLRRVVDDAKKMGLALIADADAMAIRVMSQEQERTSEDLRSVGRTVPLHGGCGGATLPRIDANGNG